MDADDEAQIRRVVEAVSCALDATMIGFYLHGSAVIGGLQPSSDLDFLAVVRRPLGDARRATLLTRLLDVSGRRATTPGRPVELTVVDRLQLECFTHPLTVDFQYGEWLREEYEAGDVPGRGPAPDVTVLLDTVHRHGRALIGPAASTIVPPTSRDELVEASLAGTDGLLDDMDGDERNVLLTFARMLVTAETGQVVPKDVAAGVVAARIHGGELVREAAADYRGRATLDWSTYTDEVLACTQELMDLIAKARLEN